MRSVQGSSPRISRASSSLALSEASEHEAEVHTEAVFLVVCLYKMHSRCMSLQIGPSADLLGPLSEHESSALLYIVI
jgi:hypothetical protein